MTLDDFERPKHTLADKKSFYSGEKKNKETYYDTFAKYKAARLAIATWQNNKRKDSTKQKKTSQNKVTTKLYIELLFETLMLRASQ